MVRAKNKPITNLQLTTENTKRFPWKWISGSVESAEVVNLLEFIPGKERGRFMDELHRILKVGGTAKIIVPYWSHYSGIKDYMYEWPPFSEVSFMYFNKDWREKNGLSKRPVVCDFDFTYGYQPEPEIAARSDEARSFALKHYSNAIGLLHLMLTKRPEK